MSVFGAYPRKTPSGDKIAAFRHPRSSSAPFQDAYLSSAPLESVVRLQVFHAGDGGDGSLCRGILLDYENGAQRALGQCRYNVDPTETYSQPAFICILETTTPPRPGWNKQRQAVRVEGACGEHGHDGDGWTCFTMEGNLEFWFTGEEASLTIMVDD